jgi:hypothetical protein
MFLFATVIVLLAENLHAQAPVAPPTESENIQLILQRMEMLETEVQTLRAEVRSLKAGAPTAVPAAVPAPTDSAAPVQSTAAGQSAEMQHAQELNAPRLQLRGYGDVNWNASDQKGTTNSFALGQLNLFITSRLTDRASFLTETVIEADRGTNTFGIEPERLMLLYNVNDALNFSIGRYHTSLGYYTTTYHHSALMQTAFGRPFLFDFEDHGGILPIHNVGVSATGVISHTLGMRYVAEIGNGRSARTALGVEPVQNVTNEHNGKAFNLALYFRPPAAPGLEFGASGYHDHRTPAVLVGNVPVNRPDVREDILTGHIVYQGTRFEFLNEGVLLRHTPDNSSTTVNIPAFYSQISRRWGRYRPYLRYEYMNVPVSDPLFADVGLRHGPTAGLRFDLSEMTAFKIQYGRNMFRDNLKVTNTIGGQFSFAF